MLNLTLRPNRVQQKMIRIMERMPIISVPIDFNKNPIPFTNKILEELQGLMDLNLIMNIYVSKVGLWVNRDNKLMSQSELSLLLAIAKKEVIL